MKYLSDYISEGQTKALERAGAFFAFSDAQYLEQRIEGVQYANVYNGLICPKDNVTTLLEELDNVYQAGVKQDIEENGLDAIIKRELANHECYYTGEVDDVVEKLEDYGAGYDEIIAVYRRERDMNIYV